MSILTKGKHIVSEIEGVRCTVVETGLSEARMQFLKDLLETNKFEVKVAKEEKKEGVAQTYILGVTDLLFNPVIAIYERSLKTKEGKFVSPANWRQYTTIYDSRYWIVNNRNDN